MKNENNKIKNNKNKKKQKNKKKHFSEILTINSPNNDLHYVTKAQWILEFPFVQIHPSIGFLIKNHLVWQDQAFPNVGHKLTPQERLHLLDRFTISFVEWQRSPNSLHQTGSHSCIEMMLVGQIKCEGNESGLHTAWRNDVWISAVTCKSHSGWL